jgi:hypothetical protein
MVNMDFIFIEKNIHILPYKPFGECVAHSTKHGERTQRCQGLFFLIHLSPPKKKEIDRIKRSGICV